MNRVNRCTIIVFALSLLSFFASLNAQSKSSHHQDDSSKQLTPGEKRRLLYGDDQTMECGKQLAVEDITRIVGGRTTRYGEFPWHVAISKQWPPEGWQLNTTKMYHCGGVIIGNRWILTAAHCLDLDPVVPTPLYAVLGTNDLTRGVDDDLISKYVRVKIASIFRHPKYNEKTFANDIAILKTEEKIDLTGNRLPINSVCLPEPYKEVPTTDAIITGFGYTKDQRLSKYLKVAKVPVLTIDDCNQFVNPNSSRRLANETVCAGNKQPGDGPCMRDCGGPLVQFNIANRAVLVGILWYDSNCGLVGIYVKVSSYIGWIFETLEANRW